MKKMMIYFKGLIVLLALIIIGYNIYLTINISATIPPVKKYGYGGTSSDLIEKLRALALRNPRIILKGDEIVGNKSHVFSNYVTMIIKEDSDSLLYELKFSSSDKVLSNARLTIIGAHNMTTHTGGYGIKADGMIKLLNQFNQDIIIPLKNANGITLKPL